MGRTVHGLGCHESGPSTRTDRPPRRTARVCPKRPTRGTPISPASPHEPTWFSDPRALRACCNTLVARYVGRMSRMTPSLDQLLRAAGEGDGAAWRELI